MKTLLKVVATTSLALTIGIATEVSVKANTWPPIIDSTINLTINSNDISYQASLSDGGDIDMYSLWFQNAGNFDIVAKEIIFPSLENSYLGDNMSLFLFQGNKLLMSGEQLGVLVSQNSTYSLVVNNGIQPILDSNNQLIDWDDDGPHTLALIPYNLNVVQNTEIPESSTVLGLILFSFLGVAGSKKKLK